MTLIKKENRSKCKFIPSKLKILVNGLANLATTLTHIYILERRNQGKDSSPSPWCQECDQVKKNKVMMKEVNLNNYLYIFGAMMAKEPSLRIFLTIKTMAQ